MRSVYISEDPGVFHAEGHDGNDFTLCGFALEGEDGNAESQPSTRRINCEKCISLIKAAWTYKKSDINEDSSHV